MNTGSHSEEIQHLDARISQASSVQEKIDALTQLSWKLRIKNHERAFSLSKEAFELSLTGQYAVQPYTPGLAASLICLAFIDSEMGNLNLALSKCTLAISMLENHVPSQLLVDAWYTMGWTNYYLGDLPIALDYGLKALDLAREIGYKSGEAWALDALASFDDEHIQFTKSHETAYHIFKELKEVEGQYRVLNNWACVLMDQGKHEAALETAQKGMQLVRQESAKREEVSLAETLGEIYIALGEYEQAYEYLQKAKSLSEFLGFDISYIAVLSSLGKVYLAQNYLDEAESHFLECLKISTKLEARLAQMVCHMNLSDVYEKHGDTDKALKHFKLYHSLKESIAGESTAKQIAMLKMSHQIETAKRDLEIQQLQNAKLQVEIEEQKRTQAILEHLATRDPLTNLYNRRHFLNLARQEWKRASRYKSEISVLMLDIDQFKQINDHYGHATGDQALLAIAGIIQSTLRMSEIAGRYGGDEFAVLLPETTSENALVVCERISSEIMSQEIDTESGSITLTVSIGVAGLSDMNREQIPMLDTLLNRADKALYKAKEAGKNQFYLYED